MKKEKTEKEKIKRIKAIDSLMALYAEKGRVGKVIKASELRKDLSNKEASALIRLHVKESYINKATKAAELEEEELSKEKISSLADATIKRFSVNESIQEARERKFSEKEIDYLVASCVEGGFIDEAVEATELRKRELSTKEIKKLTRAVRKGKDKE